MALKDSDPERRNLIVTSLAFIAYFYGGGSFSDSIVRLQVINANFSKPEILSFIAWSTFVWFIYRYWVTHRGSFVSGFKSDFNELRNKRYISNYINNHFNQNEHRNESTHEYHAAGIDWRGGYVVITCNYATISRDNNGNVKSIGSITGANHKPTELLKLNKIKGWVLAIRSTIECIFAKPSVSNYVVPYILAVIAMFGAFCL